MLLVNQLETIFFDVKNSRIHLKCKRYNDDFTTVGIWLAIQTLDEEKVAEALDAYLKEAQQNYKVARSKALKKV